VSNELFSGYKCSMCGAYFYGDDAAQSLDQHQEKCREDDYFRRQAKRKLKNTTGSGGFEDRRT
jgi:hypothetical protein